MRVYCIVIFLFLIVAGCSENHIIQAAYFYLPDGFTSSTPLECNEILLYPNSLKKRMFSNPDSLDTLSEIINNFKIQNEPYPDWVIDIRKQIFIKNNDQSIDKLCLGAFRGIIYNGARMEEDEKIFNFLKAD